MAQNLSHKEVAPVEIPRGPDQGSDLNKLIEDLALEISLLPHLLKSEKIHDFLCLVPAAAAQGIASSSFHHAANPSSVLRHARQSTQHHQLAIDGPLRVSGGAPWITTSLTCQFPHSCPTLGASTSYAGIVAEPAAATALSCSGAQVPSPPPTPFCRRQLLCPASVC